MTDLIFRPIFNWIEYNRKYKIINEHLKKQPNME